MSCPTCHCRACIKMIDILSTKTGITGANISQRTPFVLRFPVMFFSGPSHHPGVSMSSALRAIPIGINAMIIHIIPTLTISATASAIRGIININPIMVLRKNSTSHHTALAAFSSVVSPIERFEKSNKVT